MTANILNVHHEGTGLLIFYVYIRTVEYYTAIKKNDASLYVQICNKDILLSKKVKLQNNVYGVLSFISFKTRRRLYTIYSIQRKYLLESVRRNQQHLLPLDV